MNAFHFCNMHATYITQLILLDFIILIKHGNKDSYELQNGYTCKVFIMLTDVGSLYSVIFNYSYILDVNSFPYLSYCDFSI
jgi:hypothetical protein